MAADHSRIVEPRRVTSTVHQAQVTSWEDADNSPPDVDRTDRVRGAIHV